MNNKLDFEIIEQPIYYGDLMSESDSYKGIVRNDNNDLLSIMKQSYQPFKVSDLENITNRFLKISGFEHHGYSEFKGGRIILSYLKSNKASFINNHKIENYLVIGSSCDGTTSTFIGNSSIMIRCMNAWGRIHKENKVRHTISAEVKLEEIIKSVENYYEHIDSMEKEFMIWNDIQINADTAKLAIEKVFEVDDVLEDNSPYKLNNAETLKSCIQIETNALGDSLFGLFQGMTRYSSHHIDKKKSAFGSITGTAANFNQKAHKVVRELELTL